MRLSCVAVCVCTFLLVCVSRRWLRLFDCSEVSAAVPALCFDQRQQRGSRRMDERERERDREQLGQLGLHDEQVSIPSIEL
jgi:hypothetical protein